MGIAKRMWMEAQECDWEETETSFECPKCGKESDGSIDIPNISEKYTDDFTINIDLTEAVRSARDSGMIWFYWLISENSLIKTSAVMVVQG